MLFKAQRAESALRNSNCYNLAEAKDPWMDWVVTTAALSQRFPHSLVVSAFPIPAPISRSGFAPVAQEGRSGRQGRHWRAGSQQRPQAALARPPLPRPSCSHPGAAGSGRQVTLWGLTGEAPGLPLGPPPLGASLLLSFVGQPRD